METGVIFFFYCGHKTRTWNRRRWSPKPRETAFRPVITRDGQRVHRIETSVADINGPDRVQTNGANSRKIVNAKPHVSAPRATVFCFGESDTLHYIPDPAIKNVLIFVGECNVSSARAKCKSVRNRLTRISCLDDRLFGCFSTTVLPPPTPFRSPPLVHYCFTIFYWDRNDNTQYAERKWKEKKIKKKIATINCICAHNTFKAVGQRRQSADHALTIANAHNGSYGEFAVSPLHTPQLQ